ncbi:hypothetical protein [Bradyrhizobium sp. SZCCHNS3004]|uniref:hypothetical protein n=1 Tax=Bradyrhizobium sp. SZCCHNS3004 TaxID=3057312 RepID=UPI00291688C7|nr:hypothetical protein [Bradyrhizobium sp. SZCCHNS3004]
MTDSRSIIEQAPLSPPNAPSIGEGDRSRIFGMVGKQLDDIINGPSSYYPEGIKKNPDALMDDLKGLYGSVESFSKQLNDPNNIMGDVLRELKKFNDAFAPATDWSDPNDQRDKSIELPTERIPKTLDQNIIEIDPFGRPYAPPVPWKNPRSDLNVSAERPEPALDSQNPNAYRRLSSRLVYPSVRLPNPSG